MSESLKDLSLFCSVVQTGSFAKASFKLDLTPSAVSKAIARLEERLGVRLFLRSTRRMRLTEAGIEFYARSCHILDAIDEAETVVANIATEPKGDLHIAASDAFATQIIVPMLNQFQQSFPRLKVHLSQGDGPIDLMKEDFDVAIRFEEPHQKGLAVIPLADDPWVICAAPSYLKGRAVPEKPKDLDGHRCLAIRARGRLDDTWMFRGGKQQTQTILPVFSGIGIVVKLAVLEGLGIARMAEFLVRDELANGQLISLLGDYQIRGRRQIFAVTQDRGYMPEKVRVFVEALRKYLAAANDAST